MKYDYLVVGAGFAGCVLAERLASQLGKKVLLIDRRPHIAGNAHDRYDAHGIRVHDYGPHLFHTNDHRIVAYLSQFTEWHPYEHRALSSVNGSLVPIPINRKTVNELFGLALASDEETAKFLERERENRPFIRNSEDFVLARAGRRLYDLLYKGYTKKQWGLDPKELLPSVCGRLPVRTNLDDRYFNDSFQAIPLKGYTEMFLRMVDHPNIEVRLNTGFLEAKDEKFDRLVYTGQIDEFFDFVHGKLAYRSLRFEFETFDQPFVQPVAMINYPNNFEYTRSTEFKHITGQSHPKTTVAKEFPSATGEPYYPVPRRENVVMYEIYQREARRLGSVYFVGRLATYQYYNMDQVTAQSMALFERIARGEGPS